MKPGLIRLLGLCALLLFFSPKLQATHLAGGDISYTHLGGDTFEIKLNLYWDCGGALGAPFVGLPTNNNTNNINRQPPSGFGASRHNGTRIVSACGSSVTPGWVLDNPGGTEVSQLCADSLGSSECSGGSLPGLERFTYIDTVVLASCSSWTVSYVNYARNTSVNVLNSGSATMYIQAEINTVADSTNSTPVFNADPAPYYCLNDPANYDFQITDPDGDSISAFLESALQITGGGTGTISSLSYIFPFSSAQPISNSSFNSSTGVLTFTPTTAGNYIVVIEVRDYDTLGNVKSKVRRDFQVVVQSCGSNNTPQPISGGLNNVSGGSKIDSVTVETVEGDSLEFDVRFIDSGDSITISSNNTIKLSAPTTFTSSTAIDTATGTLGWRAGAASTTARTVTFTAEDDNCPVSGINSMTVSILVRDTLQCIGYNELAQSCSENADGALQARHIGGIGPYGYVWRKNGVVDPSLTTRTITNIKSTDSYSVTVIDSFNNTSCTLGSKNIAKVNEISVVSDSVFITDTDCDGNCAGVVDIREVIGGTPTTGGPTGYTYRWSGTSDTTNTPDSLCAGRYFVTISDQRSCDTVYRFFVNGPPTFRATMVDSVDVLCKGDSTGSATVRTDVLDCGITTDHCNITVLDTVGTGSSTNAFNAYPSPYGRRKKVKQQYLYRVSELTSAGLKDGDKISELGFQMSFDNFIGTVTNFEISMGCTSQDSLSSTEFIPGLFNVFSASSLSIPLGISADTFLMHSLNNSFVWNGDSNLIVEICFNNTTTGTPINANVRNTSTSYRSYAVFESDNSDACLEDTVLSSGSRHPNLRFALCGSEFTYNWTSSATDSTANNLWAATHFVTVTNEENCADTVSVVIDEPAVALTASVDSLVNVNCASDTSGSAFITVSGGTGPYIFTWPAGVSTGANDSIGINLTSGINYVVTVQDISGCEDTAAFSLSDLSNLTVSITDSLSILCFGDTNGRLFATPDSGDLPYSYAWTDLGGGGTVSTLPGFDSVAVDLGAGTYRIVVTDSVGCKDSVEATLSDPPALSASFTDSTLLLCNGDTNGSLTVTPTGGTPAYTFTWFQNGGGTVSTGTSDSIAINLSADTFAVLVIDANGCRDTLAREMTEPTALSLSFMDSTSIGCPGGADGSLTITPSGGTPGYTYTWGPGTISTGASDSIAISLTQGTYTVTVTDNNTCTAVDSASLTDPVGLSVSFTDSTQVACNGSATGSLTATPSNGTGPYTWTWIDISGGSSVSTGATDSIAINLTAGTYRVIGQDANGCQDSADITLSDPVAMSISIVDSTSVLCNGDNNGSLTAAVTGGTPGYTFTWTPAVSTPTADSIAESLSGGVSFEVLVVDTNGCRDSVSQTLQDPAALTAGFTDSSSVQCNGDANGSLTVTPSGGTPGYTYNWSAGTAGASDSIRNGLSGGVAVTVTVTDDNSCTTTISQTLQDPAAITAIFTDSTLLSCNGDSNATLTVTPQAGAQPFSFAWSPAVTTGASDSIATGLTSGVLYTVVVTDGNGCQDSVSRTLAAPSALVAQIFDSTSILCAGDTNGTLFGRGVSGSGPYAYAWKEVGSAAVVDTGVADSIAVNLGASTYRLIVIDNNGCQDSTEKQLVDPTSLTAAFTDSTVLTCTGPSNNGSLTVTPSGGTPGYTFTWGPGTITTGASDSIAINLSASILYSVTVMDNNGCTANISDSLTDPTNVSANFTTIQNPLCAGDSSGQLIVTPNTGTPPFTYTWNLGTAGASDSIRTNLPGGVAIFVTVTDNGGCSDTVNVSLIDPLPLNSFFSDSTTVDCNGDTTGSLTVTPINGTAPYTYIWTPAVATGASDSIAINLSGSTQYVVQIQDVNGCTVNDTANLSEPSALSISFTASNNIVCNGDSTGSATITPSGGTPGYSYNWTASHGGAVATSPDSVAINLPAATYFVTVTDNNTCTQNDSIVISEPTAISATVDTFSAACGTSTGMAVVNPSGGTTPYTFAWDSAGAPLGILNDTAQNLFSGIYNVLVTDSNSCTASFQAIISDQGAPVISLDSLGDASCEGVNDGAIFVSVVSSNGTVTYNWSNGATSEDITNLGDSVYTLTATDSVGCSSIFTDTVNNAGVLATNMSSVPLNCTSTVCDGEVKVTASGVTGPFTYQWSTSLTDTLDSVINLCAGTYTVTVTSLVGCQAIDSATLTTPATFTLNTSTDSVSCNGSTDGVARVDSITGGLAPFTYAWSTSLTDTLDSVVNLGAGQYRVTVTASDGCVDVDTLDIFEPDTISASFATVNADCGVSNGSVTATTSGGNGVYNYLWPVGGSTSNNVDTGYAAGVYTVTISDQKACNNTFGFTINNNNAPTITLDSILDETCAGDCDGGIYVTVTGGLPTYNALWTGGSTDIDLDSVCPGIYTLRITDQNNCIVFYSDTIDAADPLNLSISLNNNASNTTTCDGSATASITGGTSPYTFLWTSGETSQTATSLCVGTNFVTVTDSLGCTAIDSIVITAPVSIVLDSSNVTDNVCLASPCVGQVFVLASGGSGTLSYLWDNGDVGQTTTARCAGLATVTVTDALGDTASFGFLVNDAGGPSITKFKSDASCFLGNDGQAWIIASGSGPFTFNWPSLGSTNDTVSALSAGSYEVRVTDTAGCTSVDTINIVQPGQLTASFATDLATCGVSDGEIRASVGAGTPPYSYQWLDLSLSPLVPPQTSDTGRNLASGIYNFIVTDDNGCSRVFNVTLSDSGAPVIAIDSIVDETCFGLNDGGIFVSLTGIGPLTYLWSNGDTTQDLSNVDGGGYTLQVTDTAGCNAFLSDTVGGATPIVTSVTVVNTVSSSTICDGEANISVLSGGVSPYTFSWSTGTSGNSTTNLCNGANFVTTTDSNGCQVIDTINLSPANVIVLDSSETTNPNCNSCNGVIRLYVSGGTAPYTYAWDNGDSADSTSGRCAGVINVTVTDDAGLSETFVFTLSDLPSPSFTLGGNDASCFGSNDGLAYVTILSGTPPITINWLGLSATGDTARDLSAGIYGVEVSDIFGCTATDTIQIDEPEEINVALDVQDALCGANDGSIVARILTSGGFPPYNFVWLDEDTLPLVPSQTSDTLSGIGAGVYFLTVTDANGCSELFNGNLSNVGGPTVTLDSISDESCQGDCDGEIQLTTSGSGTLLYNWLPGSQTTEDLTGLCSGNYIISVTDGLGCVTIRSYDILPADSFNLVVNTITDATCENTFDGSIDMNLTGNASGFIYDWTGPGGFSASNLDLSGLSPGTYDLLVTDGNGCEDSASASISFTTTIDVTASNDTFLCSSVSSIFLEALTTSNGTVQYTWYDDQGFILGNLPIVQATPREGFTQYLVEASSGLCLAYDTVNVTFSVFVRADAGRDQTIDYGDEVQLGGNPTTLIGDSAFWTSDSGSVFSSEANPIVKPEETTTYALLVSDPLGCFAIDTVTITVNPLKVNDGFTPNGDGVNDTWELPILDDFPDATVDIYNRWGQLVYSARGYTTQFDGRYKGKDLPVGTYYYVIDLNDQTVEQRLLTGPVTIMR